MLFERSYRTFIVNWSVVCIFGEFPVRDKVWPSITGFLYSLTSHPVVASLPLCDVTEEDLTQNPQLCKLLATLSQHVDQHGLTVPLKTELEKVSQGTGSKETLHSQTHQASCFPMDVSHGAI